MAIGFHTCMHCTRLPFCTERSVWALEANRVALLRPEKPLMEADSEVVTAEEAAANAAGATTVEAATTEAISRSRQRNQEGNSKRDAKSER
jgi:hypothetical protein